MTDESHPRARATPAAALEAATATDDAGASNAAGPPPQATRREWLGLAVIALPCMLYAMDLTVLNLALPRIAADLQPSGATLLWIVDIYGFFVAGLLVTMGNLGDRIGRRRLLLVGAAAFGLASVVAAMSRTAGMLIAARAVLGVAGATLAPSTLSLIRNMFLHPRQRTVAIGVWTASYSVGGAIGPLLGGAMLQRFHWGAVFLLAVPVMVLLLATGPILLPESRAPSARRLDLASAALSLAAVLSVIYGLKVSVQGGGAMRLPLLSVGVGLGLGALFVRRQRRLAAPLIDLRLFRTRAFSLSLALYMLATLLTFGAYVLVGQYLQLVAGLSPLAVGLWMLPWSASYVIGSFLAPALARRIQPAYVMGGGLALAAAGFFAVTRVAGLGVEAVIIASTAYSLGLSPVFTLGIDAIVAAAPAERAGAAAALSETGSELGGALGIAVLGSVATAIYRAHLGQSHLPDLGLPPAARDAALDTLGAAAAAAAKLGPVGGGVRLLDAAQGAFTHALRVTLTLCAGAAAVMSVFAAVTLRRASPRRRRRRTGPAAYGAGQPPSAVVPLPVPAATRKLPARNGAGVGTPNASGSPASNRTSIGPEGQPPRQAAGDT
jgi:DHA2 family multidrug resistance protein-like MFS transporter